jgi:hypothetical protein
MPGVTSYHVAPQHRRPEPANLHARWIAALSQPHLSHPQEKTKRTHFLLHPYENK